MRISNCPNEPKDNTELTPNALYVPHTPRPEDHGKFIDHISNTFSMEIFVFRFHIIVNDVMDNDLALVGWQIVTWTNVEYISDWTWRHLVTLTESTVKYARKFHVISIPYIFLCSRLLPKTECSTESRESQFLCDPLCRYTALCGYTTIVRTCELRNDRLAGYLKLKLSYSHALGRWTCMFSTKYTESQFPYFPLCRYTAVQRSAITVAKGQLDTNRLAGYRKGIRSDITV